MTLIRNCILGFWLLHTLLNAPFWSDLNQAADGRLNYEQKRTWFAFNGVDVDALSRALNQKLPPNQPLGFVNEIVKNDFLMQRLSEGLYPRKIDENSPYKLALQPFAQTTTVASEAPVYESGPIKFYLSALPTEAAKPQENPEFVYEASFLQFLLSFFALLGLGWCCSYFLRKLNKNFSGISLEIVSTLPKVGFYCLTGGVVSSYIVSLSTWLQVPAFSANRVWFGLLAFLLMLVLRRTWFLTTVKNIVQTFPTKPSFFSSFVILSFLVLFWQLWNFPISLWDGRSVWFFNTKKLFFSGMMPLEVLLKPEYQWSNPIYPLLIPSWHTFFQGLAPVYNEHQIALGISVLFISLTSVFYFLLEKVSGKITATAAMVFLFIFSNHMITGGYVDIFVTLLLLNSLLALGLSANQSITGHRRMFALIAWIHLSALSLIKAEGLALAIFLLILFFFITKSPLRTFRLSSALLMGITHRVWANLRGVKSVFSDVIPNYTLEDYVSRFFRIFAELPNLISMPGYLQFRYIFPQTFIAILCCAGIFFLVWIEKHSISKLQKNIFTMCALIALVFTGISTVVILRMPYDIGWLVHVTYDRLLIHACGLILLGTLTLFSYKVEPKI